MSSVAQNSTGTTKRTRKETRMREREERRGGEREEETVLLASSIANKHAPTIQIKLSITFLIIDCI